MTPIKHYESLVSIGTKYKDSSFCSVVAFSMALGITFEQSWSLLKQNGRVTNRGVNTKIITDTLDSIGVVYERVRRVAKTVAKFNGKGNYIITTCNHALCHQFGETVDHTAGSRRRIESVFKIIEIPVNINELIKVEEVITNPKPTRRTEVNRYAMIHERSKTILKVYSRKPKKGCYKFHINGDTSTIGELSYIKFDEQTFLENRELFWENASRPENQFTTKEDLDYKNYIISAAGVVIERMKSTS